MRNRRFIDGRADPRRRTVATPGGIGQARELSSTGSEQMGNTLEASRTRLERLVRFEDEGVLREGAVEHGTVIGEPVAGVVLDPRLTEDASFTTPETALPFACDLVVPSWNVVCTETALFEFDLRVGDGDGWSSWLRVGRWGRGVPRPGTTSDDDWGEVDVDFLWTRRPFDRVQFRAVARGQSVGKGRPAVRRVCLAVSGPGSAEPGDPGAETDGGPEPQSAWNRRLPVPFRSQLWEAPEIAWSVCSPTSVAMVLESYGVDVPTSHVIAAIYDAEHGMYGNWSRAVQTAYAFGVPGWLERFPDWRAVRTRIAEGRPVVASVRVGEGELAGSPYTKSEGHLLVLTGFDGDERVCVNDPAAGEEAVGRTTYAAADLERVWLQRSRLGYVFAPPEPAAPQPADIS